MVIAAACLGNAVDDVALPPPSIPNERVTTESAGRCGGQAFHKVPCEHCKLTCFRGDFTSLAATR